MIQIEDVKEVPNALWTSTSQEELDAAGPSYIDFLLANSKEIKLFTYNNAPLLIAGLYRKSLISDVYLWALVSSSISNLSPGVFRKLIRAADDCLGDTFTCVQKGNENAERFARLFKFEPSSKFLTMAGKEYEIYRRVKWLS